MAETITQEASRYLKCTGDVFVSVLLGLAFSCIAASAVGLVVILTFRCPGCSSVTSSSLLYAYWTATVLLLLLGVMTLALLVYYKIRQHRTTFSVAISSIPAEDLEKTPAPTLHFHHRASQPQQLDQASSTHPTSLDLPSYYSVVQNIDKDYSSENSAEVSSENVPETPPPRYEEAIEITTLALFTGAASPVDTFSSIPCAFTQETMGKSDEIFV